MKKEASSKEGVEGWKDTSKKIMESDVFHV